MATQPLIRQIPSKHSSIPVNGKDHSNDAAEQPLTGHSSETESAPQTVGEAAGVVPVKRPANLKPESKKAAAEPRQYEAREDGESFFDWINSFPTQDWEKDYLAIYKMTPNLRMVEKVNGPVDEEWLEQNIVPKYGAGVYQIQFRARSGKHKNDHIKIELGDIRDAHAGGNSGAANQDAGNQQRGIPRNDRTIEAGFSQVMRDVSSAHLEASKQNLSLMRESVGSGNPIALVKEVLALARGSGESESLVATLIKMQAENSLAMAKLQAENSQALAKLQADFTDKRLEADRQHREEMKALLEKKEEGSGPLGMLEKVASAIDAIDGLRDRVGSGSGDVQQKGWLGLAQTAIQSPVLGQVLGAIAAATAAKNTGPGIAPPARPVNPAAPEAHALPPASTPAEPSTPAASPFPFPVQSIIELVGRLQGAIYREDFDNADYYADMIDVEYQPIAGWIRQTEVAQIVSIMQGDPRGQALFATEQSQKFIADVLEELKEPAPPAEKKKAATAAKKAN